MSVVDAYIRLHRAGYCRDSEYEQRNIRRNILVREDGRPCLIDFSRAIRHKCDVYRSLHWLTTQLRFRPLLHCEEVNNAIGETDVYEDGELASLAVV